MNTYVTFQIKPSAYCRALGMETKKYAIECPDMESAQEVAADVNSLDGVTYLRINKSGKLGQGVTIIHDRASYLNWI